jgi:DNA-binding Lrp family transcriptional regulator
MVATSYVLVKVAAGKARQVYDELSKLKGIQHVDAISGPFDLVAVVQGTDFSAIGRMVIDKIQAIEGITDTITCNVISFEV